jgi:tetratricopeptide (TPR) repeat protein
MPRCLTEEELALLADGEPAPELARHLERCTTCAARLADERRDAELFQELRRAAHARARPAIPGYRLEAELSRGGQGVVWRAVQEATQRVVALKLLDDAATASARVRRRFAREVELASRLAHPGIVTVFDGGVAEGTLWYAMELVEGEPLDAWVARARPDEATRLALFLELCEAVAHAHRAGVIHRDLKPENVLVDRARRVRVLDFGAALPLAPRAEARVTARGEFLGTLAYAAPEQVRGGEHGGDTRTDVYALGVVLYELLAGELPLALEGGLAAVVARIEHDVPRLLARVAADLATIVARALEKEPERRYPSVEALARAVRHQLAHEPIEARAHSPGNLQARFVRRHRRTLAGAAAGLVLFGTLLGAWARARLETGRARANAALVRGVFEDVLAAAGPRRMGGDAPLREVLALAAREIEQGLEGAPDVQAAVQLTIGATYGELLRFDEAEPHLRAAVARFRALDGAELELAQALDALGRVLAALASPEAVAVQTEALALRRARLAADDPLVAASERGLATARLARMLDAEAGEVRALLETACARFRRALGDEHAEVAATRLVLAQLERADGTERSEGELALALAIFERPENARDPRRIDALVEQASRLSETGRFDEAQAVLARAQELSRALYGDEQAVEVLRQQANLFYARGEHAQAEELTRRALVLALRGWLESRGDMAAEIEELARALEEARPPAVEPPYVAAFRLLRRFEGDGAFELAGWMNGIALVLIPQGRHAPAEALLTEALEIRCRSWGAECPLRQRTCVLLAEVARAAEDAPAARRWLEESIAIAERRGEPESAARARGRLAELRAEAERD